MIQAKEPNARTGGGARNWRSPRIAADRGAVPVDARVRAGAETSGRNEALTVHVAGDIDAQRARRYAAAFATQTGLAEGDRVVIDAVVAELAANVLRFAGAGEFVFASENAAGRTGMVIIARDRGPGIPDVSRAMMDGFSTSGRAGLGLATASRLMDSFEVASVPGQGTTITMKKWRLNCR